MFYIGGHRDLAGRAPGDSVPRPLPPGNPLTRPGSRNRFPPGSFCPCRMGVSMRADRVRPPTVPHAHRTWLGSFALGRSDRQASTWQCPCQASRDIRMSRRLSAGRGTREPPLPCAFTNGSASRAPGRRYVAGLSRWPAPRVRQGNCRPGGCPPTRHLTRASWIVLVSVE